MYCLRHFLPILFLSTSASPYFVLLLAVSFAFAHRPCIYCSVILLTLFSTSCYWSDRCLLDLNNGDIFTARPPADGRTMGVGIGWLRALMGNKTWRFPCVGVRVVA